MPNALKARIILPVVLLNTLFLVCIMVLHAIRLADVLPQPLVRSLLVNSAVGGIVWLALVILVMVVIIGKWETMLNALVQQMVEIGRGHIRSEQSAAGAIAAGTPSKAISEMSSFLDQTLMKIIAASGRLFTSTSHLQGAAERCASSASSQQQESHAIATAAEEMSQTIASIARNATTAADTSLNALEIVAEGSEIVSRAVEAAARVDSATGELAGGIESLKSSVLEIGDIVAVIEDIADQTNLLALNAAIEAARSGEHGRGFAVVADEVRNLAARTIKATSEISGKIAAVQRESNRTSSSMEESSREVQNARTRIGDMEVSLRRIASSFEQVNSQIDQIATAVEQQTATTHQISVSIDATSQMSGTLTAISANVMDEVSLLGSVTDELLLVLGAFRLGSHYTAAAAIEELASGQALRSMERGRREQELHAVIQRHPYVELFYITDAAGRQITSNIAADSKTGTTAYGSDGFGMNWSNRPWFRGAKESGTTYISELYRSVATDSFCCTIAVPIRDAGGNLNAVLGADINVAKISSLN